MTKKFSNLTLTGLYGIHVKRNKISLRGQKRKAWWLMQGVAEVNTYRQSEVVLVFLVKLSSEVFCCWFRKFAFFIQNVYDSCLFRFNKICNALVQFTTHCDP